MPPLEIPPTLPRTEIMDRKIESMTGTMGLYFKHQWQGGKEDSGKEEKSENSEKGKVKE